MNDRELTAEQGQVKQRNRSGSIIYYNSAILSRLLTKYEAIGNAKALAMLKKISPAAWRHTHLTGTTSSVVPGSVQRPGCDRGGTGGGVTEFSGVPAYIPHHQLKRGAEAGEDLKPTLQNWKMPGYSTKTQTRPHLRFVRLPASGTRRFFAYLAEKRKE